jgi:hypothetical protein
MVEFYHTIYQNPNFQVSNLGKVRPTVPAIHSEHNYKSRLTYEQVILLRFMHKMGTSNFKLSKIFGYSHAGICNITARRRWKDI